MRLSTSLLEITKNKLSQTRTLLVALLGDNNDDDPGCIVATGNFGNNIQEFGWFFTLEMRTCL